jgi:hypothetical protein
MVLEPRSLVHFLPLRVIILTYLSSRGLGFNSPGHTFFSLCNNSKLHCCLLSTHMVKARGRDSHERGGMLDHSIRTPHPISYHLDFMVGLVKDVV